MTVEEQIELEKNIAIVNGDINRYKRFVNISGVLCSIMLIDTLYCLITFPLGIFQILPIAALIITLAFFIRYKNKLIHNSEVLKSIEKSDLLFFTQ